MARGVDLNNARLSVRLTPRAARDEVGGFEEETLRVRVAAPPVDGRANEALTRLLASKLRVSRGAVRVVAGETSRLKIVAIEGLSDLEVRRRLGDAGQR
jgi:uncharacterized protein (TIGR00251 family)